MLDLGEGGVGGFDSSTRASKAEIGRPDAAGIEKHTVKEKMITTTRTKQEIPEDGRISYKQYCPSRVRQSVCSKV